MTLTAPLRELLGKATPKPWIAEKRKFGWWMSAAEDKPLMPGELPFEDARAVVALRNLAEPYIVDALDALDKVENWVSQMPDAGFTDQSPRWDWWNKRPPEGAQALKALRSALDRENLA